MSTGTTLALVRGDTNEYDIEVKKGTVAQNLTGMSLRFTAKTDPLDPDADAEIRKTIGSGITVTDAVQGKARLTLLPADTASMPIGNPTSRGEYYTTPLSWDLQMTDSSGNVYTLARGKIVVRGDISLTVP
jgi:hypothetical protein